MFNVEYKNNGYFRLIAPNGKTSAWQPYDGFATVEVDRITYVICTDYWRGVFPTNHVFALVPKNSVQTYLPSNS